mgnify:CR=1 FL=1
MTTADEWVFAIAIVIVLAAAVSRLMGGGR